MLSDPSSCPKAGVSRREFITVAAACSTIGLGGIEVAPTLRLIAHLGDRVSMPGDHNVRVYPMPPCEPLSHDFTVSAGNKSVPVYLARVCSLTSEEREVLGDSSPWNDPDWGTACELLPSVSPRK
jgi:hypothetical protein